MDPLPMTAEAVRRRSAVALRWMLMVLAVALPPSVTIVGVAAVVLVALAQRPGWAGVSRAALMALAAVLGTVVLYAGG